MEWSDVAKAPQETQTPGSFHLQTTSETRELKGNGLMNILEALLTI